MDRELQLDDAGYPLSKPYVPVGAAVGIEEFVINVVVEDPLTGEQGEQF